MLTNETVKITLRQLKTVLTTGKWGGKKLSIPAKSLTIPIRPGFLLKTKKSDTKVEKKTRNSETTCFGLLKG